MEVYACSFFIRMTMSKLTTSEIIFEQFCATHGITYERIPTKAERTPDYEITVGEQRIVAEIKQIDPNPNERIEMEQFAKNGWVVGGRGAPGDRMRNVIHDANGQLKQLSKEVLPSILIVYDNVPIASHTAPYCILVAMYGLQQLNLQVPRDKTQTVRLVGVSFGGKRKMTIKTNTSTSAVAVIHNRDNGEYTLDIYHNVFARVPLDYAMFDGLPVRQYTLQDPGNGEFQDWIRIDSSINP